MATRNPESNDSWRAFIFSPYVPDAFNRHLRQVLVERPPVATNERLAFPHPDSVKRAALLVDRIYVPCWAGEDKLEDLPHELTFGDPHLDQQTAEQTWMAAEVFWPWKLDDPQAKLDELLRMFLRDPLSRYRLAFPQASVFPINYDAGTTVLPVGNHHVYQGVLNNVPVVIEQDLTWHQVLEFRRDAEARRKYRDLHIWLQQQMKVESEQHVTALIAQRLEDYRWAIRKHGLKSSLEAISSFVSLSSIVPPAGILVAAQMGITPVAGALVGGALAVAGATAWIAKRLLDLEDIKRGQHREVAYLYALQRLAQ